MDRRKLVAEVARKTPYAKWEINSLIDPVLNSILEALQKGDEVHISGFGRFKLKVSKARAMIHPKTKKRTFVPEKAKVVFAIHPKFKVGADVIEVLKGEMSSGGKPNIEVGKNQPFEHI